MKFSTFTFTALSLLCGAGAASAQGVDYPHPFQPSTEIASNPEHPSRERLVLSGAWEFMPVYDASADDFTRPERFVADAVPLKIPSPWNVNDFTDGSGGDFRTYPSYPAEWEKARMGWMRRTFEVPADLAGRRLTLRFDGIMGKAQIWVNGEPAGENFELFLPSEYDVTDLVRPGQKNEIMVGVAKGSLFDQPGPYGRRTYVGGSMWGIEMVGVWQDVWLVARPAVHVRGVTVRPDVEKGELTLDVEIDNTTGERRSVGLDIDIRRWMAGASTGLHSAAGAEGRLDGAVALEGGAKKIVAGPGVTRHTVTIAGADVLDRWSPDAPNLYGLTVALKEGRTTTDVKYQRFGWRQFGEKNGKLTLNGEPIELRGDSWHFTGVPQMTRRYAWAWYNALKDAGANAVRLHAMPFPEFYLDVADEMGICVLDESGIWSSDGGPKVDSEAYWESCREHLTRLVARDINHPSVFGWSVCNETVPVVMHVYKAPEELVQRQLKEINGWVALVRSLDPTRPWISGDGETDRPTDLPTVIGHYGDDAALKHWSSQGKPWGVGETSMAYYGTPKQTSKINGNRSYESMEGRMEAIAQESYDLITKQRALGASYASVFNIAWYGLKPLPLGLDDESRAPELEDGIRFPAFVEGRAGMQPERLGPWSTTLNPGYDPELPLYRPWPMFYAVQAANATPVKPWSAPSAAGESARNAEVPTLDAVKVFAAEGSSLAASLAEAGLVTARAKTALTARSLAIVDGAMPPVAPAAVAELQKAIAAGARVIVLGATPESLDALNKILPRELTLTPRRATSLLKRADTPLLAGLAHGDFYFSELLGASQSAMRYSLGGDLVAHSTVVLEAAKVDWQRWNYRPETTKTANVFRSEVEKKCAGAAIAEYDGRVWVSSLDFADMASEGEMLVRIMLTNLGARFDGDRAPVAALDADHRLKEALILGAFNDSSKNAQALAAHPFVDEATLNPQPGARTGDKIWFRAGADPDGRIDIRRSQISGSNESAAVYISFRLFSPRSLVNLLAEPNMPRLGMELKTADRYAMIVNGVEFSRGAANNDGVTIENLPLEKGWNHIVIKIARGTGNSPWGVSARMVCDDAEYISALGSAISRSSLEVTEALK
jgi:beta-galactosidase